MMHAPPSAGCSEQPLRAVIHVDMDAFYAQVEQVRLGVPASVPLCVQQWNGLIAVNYAAREYGITRMMTLDEATRRCPELKLVHVATLAIGDVSGPREHAHISYKTHKVSLDVYRQASIKVMDAIRQSAPEAVFQRCSIDEAFLDVTESVMKTIETEGLRLTSQTSNDHVDGEDDDIGTEPVVHWDADVHQVGDRVESSTGLGDLMLSVAAKIAARVRAAIFEKLQYTSSAGIAHNKMLAKLVSAANKPNKQTVLRKENVLEYMKTVKLTKIRGLGGKLGHDVIDAYDITMASELMKYPQAELVARFGLKHGTMLYHACRGDCFEPVQICPMIKTIGATKSLRPPVTTEVEAKKWVTTLSAELYARATQEDMLTGRWPRRLELYSRGPSGSSRKPTFCVFPPRTCASVETIFTRSWSLFLSVPDRFPCRGLYMAALDLVAISGEAELASSLARWLQSAASAKDNVGDDGGLPLLSPATLVGMQPQRSPPFTLTSREDDDQKVPQQNDHDQAKDEALYGIWVDNGCIQCPVCGQAVSPDNESQMEHSDFHYAQELARTFNGTGSSVMGRLTIRSPPLNSASSSHHQSRRLAKDNTLDKIRSTGKTTEKSPGKIGGSNVTRKTGTNSISKAADTSSKLDDFFPRTLE